LIEQIVKRYGSSSSLKFDPANINANESLAKIIQLTFIITAYFTLIPFSVYMYFRSQGPPANDTTYMRFFMLYAYSMAVFIPGAAIYSFAIQFYRVQWLCLAASVGLASYF